MNDRKIKIAVFSLGCKVNQYEGQAMVCKLAEKGYAACEGLENADFYVINTCSVTAEADKKSRQAVARALKLNPAASVFVCGCSSQNDLKQYGGRKNVVAVSGAGGKGAFIGRVLEYIESKKIDDCGGFLLPVTEGAEGGRVLPERGGAQLFGGGELPKIYEDDLTSLPSRSRGYIKIQDGCDNFCSYCIVPYLRGASRSRSVQSIVDEAAAAASLGCEIVLTGVNISAYGKDTGSDLIGLLGALEGFKCRFRFGSLECGVIDERLLRAMKRANFCEHFHLSLQSASDGVLQMMNRKYTFAQYKEKVGLIREFFPNAGITTDMIAGFPEESLEQHRETLRNIQSVGFSDMHVFAYSVRKGTAAERLKPLPPEERARRAGEIAAVRDLLRADFLAAQVGEILQVYPEQSSGTGTVGHSRNFVRVYSDAPLQALSDVKITELFKDGVKGEIIK